VTDGADPLESRLRRVAGAPVLVDADEFARVLEGWTELDAIDEVCGALLMVRVGSDQPAEAVAAAIAAAPRSVDLIGPADPGIAGVLIDATAPEVDACARSVHRDLSAHFVEPVWVANLMVRGLSAAAAIEQGRLLLRAAQGRPEGGVLALDETA